jgi:hypothetical protein
MKATAIGDVITAVTAALDADTTYRVFDGPISKRPGRGDTTFVVVGSEEPWLDEDDTPVSAAHMSQEWKGLGQPARDEELLIPCCAVGKSSTVALARGLALGAVQDTFDNLGLHPTNETYNALVNEVVALDSRNVPGGAVVIAKFTIMANARLI